MNIKAFILSFLVFSICFSTRGQVAFGDSIKEKIKFKLVEDDPTKFSKWSLGVGLGYYLVSNKISPLTFTGTGFYHFNEDYKLDFRMGISLKNDEERNPIEIEKLRFSEYQITIHKRLLSKISLKNRQLNYKRDEIGAQLFKSKYIPVSQKKRLALDLDFGINYLQISDFEDINLGNNPTDIGEIPKIVGNSSYTSFTLGFSLVSSRYLKYQLDKKEEFTVGYVRYYINYSYAFSHRLEIYEDPNSSPIAENQEETFVSIYNSGFKFGIEAHDHLVSGPISSYYGFEIGWRPHFHDVNTTLDHIRGTGLYMMFSVGLRLAELPF